MSDKIKLERNYQGIPVHVGLSAANMTLCEQMHLTANGCSQEHYDPDCMECPYNPASPDYEPESEE